MVYVVVAVFIGIVVAIVFSRRKGDKYYDKIFSEAHFVEIVGWLHSVLQLGEVPDPVPENNTAFQTSAECALTFTRQIDQLDVVHIAISQVGRHTTHAVCNRLGFVIFQALASNGAQYDFFYTQSSVHHLIFAKAIGGEWLVNDAQTVLATMDDYEPPPYRFQSVEETL